MRISTLRERKEFYENEFDILLVKRWLRHHKNPVFAIDIGTESGLYLEKHRKLLKKLVYISKYRNWGHLKKKFVFYLPEDVYYDRNIVKDYGLCRACKTKESCMECKNLLAQELVFDLDPENVPCKCKRLHIYSFCDSCLAKIRQNTIDLYHYLKKRFNKLKIVYSGRGYHIHVFDKKSFTLTYSQRKQLSQELIKKGFYIDPWVTNGHIRLVRLPGSLHGLVSRICMPVTLKEIKMPIKKAVPRFIQ
jgi:DNA primase catalytic subunit